MIWIVNLSVVSNVNSEIIFCLIGFEACWLCKAWRVKCLFNVSNGYFHTTYCQTPVLGLGLGVDFTFAWDNNNDNNNNKNPHLNFLKGTVLDVKG